ncbi:MAG: hypothetical protein KF752_00140 [Pirellulaceae bacterium]|nr:hypothetical protein [Pirellulaceae bacterium]
MSDAVVMRVIELLTASNIQFKHLQHEPTLTSEDSARERGESLEVGAKALLLKAETDYLIAVLPAHRKLDSGLFKRWLGIKNLRFASAEELWQLAGVLPGALPPFGEPIFPVPLYADSTVGAVENRVAFNAGCRTQSIIMALGDWLSVAKPIVSNICAEGQ